MILKNKKTAFGYKGVCRMHAKTGGEIIFLKTANYKKRKELICCICNMPGYAYVANATYTTCRKINLS
ncbi:hypothetical protein NUKP84_02110 [Klebsiella variicola]|nr:hypothetical protein NUKP84_02110 [Klebsiella variicola]